MKRNQGLLGLFVAMWVATGAVAAPWGPEEMKHSLQVALEKFQADRGENEAMRLLSFAVTKTTQGNSSRVTVRYGEEQLPRTINYFCEIPGGTRLQDMVCR